MTSARQRAGDEPAGAVQSALGQGSAGVIAGLIGGGA